MPGSVRPAEPGTKSAVILVPPPPGTRTSARPYWVHGPGGTGDRGGGGTEPAGARGRAPPRAGLVPSNPPRALDARRRGPSAGVPAADPRAPARGGRPALGCGRDL